MVKYMEKHLDVTKPHYSEQILPVSRHCTSLHRRSTITASHDTINTDIYLSAAQEKNDSPGILNIYEEGKPVITVGK